MKKITAIVCFIALASCSTGNHGNENSSSSFNAGESSSSKDNSSSSSSSSSNSVNSNSSSSFVSCTGGVSGNVLTDGRDCKQYGIVKIGNLTWMAENLNYVFMPGYSWCYGDDGFGGYDENCEKYGRLYKWDANGLLCPQGWHLPTYDDLLDLIEAVGDVQNAGKKLKSTADWDNSGNGTNESGFAALPGGRGLGDDYDSMGKTGYWWLFAADDPSPSYPFAYVMSLAYNSNAVLAGSSSKSNRYSVRCVKD